MNLLRLWLLGTGTVIAVLFMWAYAPILILLLGVTGGLGVVVAAAIRFAHAIAGHSRDRNRQR